MKTENQGEKSESKTKNEPKLSKSDKKLLRLVNIAKEIVFKEDEELFKELAKH